MPRAPRTLIEDGTYHVTARGNRRQEIFCDHSDYQMYLSLYDRFRKESGMRSLAFALMPNHVHLLLQDKGMQLSRFIHRLHGVFAQYHNEKYSRVGHLFQDRFYSKPCTSDEQLLVCVRYVHLNPWRAGLVQHPKEYPWSSYKLYLQERTSPLIDAQILRDHFGKTRYHAANGIRLFTEGAMYGGATLDDAVLDYKLGLAEDARECLSKIWPAIAKSLRISVTQVEMDKIPHRYRAQLIKAIAQLRCFTTNEIAQCFRVAPSTISRCKSRRT